MAAKTGSGAGAASGDAKNNQARGFKVTKPTDMYRTQDVPNLSKVNGLRVCDDGTEDENTAIVVKAPQI